MKSPYLDEQQLLRSIRTPFRDKEIQLLPDAIIMESNDTEIDVHIPSNFIRESITTNQLALMESIVGKKITLSSLADAKKHFGVKETL